MVEGAGVAGGGRKGLSRDVMTLRWLRKWRVSRARDGGTAERKRGRTYRIRIVRDLTRELTMNVDAGQSAL